MTQRGYWRHTESGQIWAVEIENERPVRCAGPLKAEDLARDLLPYLNYSTSYIALLYANWQSYVPQELCSICGAALHPGTAATPDGLAHLSCSV
jgi:hypothetical protein